MTDNIISFPESRIVREDPNAGIKPIDHEEIKARVQLMNHLHVQEVIETLMPIVFSQLTIGGFDFSEDADIKDAAFITEAIRSVLCKQKQIDHPFQKVADQIFIDENDGILSVVDTLNINFKPEEPLEEATPT